MASTSTNTIKLSSNEKEKLVKLLKDFDGIKWEDGEYYFHNFVDYYQLPQLVRVKQAWNSGLADNQWIYLQSLFDRYLIVASPLVTLSKVSNEKYLIPDWFQGECRILSKQPRLKPRWWVFQGAFELYRFDTPRSIKVLSHTPAHRQSNESSRKHEWDKIVLTKNSQLNVIGREQYQSRVTNSQGELSISEPKEAFLLEDPKTNERFLIPPGVPLRFATRIKDQELHHQYYSHDGTFTFPEIMIRYEFPIDIEIQTHLPIDIPEFKSQVRLEKYCVAKSIFAYSLESKRPKLIELAPLIEFTVSCAK